MAKGISKAILHGGTTVLMKDGVLLAKVEEKSAAELDVLEAVLKESSTGEAGEMSIVAVLDRDGNPVKEQLPGLSGAALDAVIELILSDGGIDTIRRVLESHGYEVV